jgi:hypothetical protein
MSPISGKLFARVAAGSRADGRAAVDSAAKAFAGWAETTPAEKAGQSSRLSNLFSGPNRTWSFVPQLTQPIFTAGRLKPSVHRWEKIQ